jgi:hypothetical protein
VRAQRGPETPRLVRQIVERPQHQSSAPHHSAADHRGDRRAHPRQDHRIQEDGHVDGRPVPPGYEVQDRISSSTKPKPSSSATSCAATSRWLRQGAGCRRASYQGPDPRERPASRRLRVPPRHALPSPREPHLHKLAARGPGMLAKRNAERRSPSAGILYGSLGRAMSPSHAIRGSRRYRYSATRNASADEPGIAGQRVGS